MLVTYGSIEDDGGGVEEQFPATENSGESQAGGEEGSGGKLRRKRQQVSRACSNCRLQHVACTETRPCDRCKSQGLAHLCADVPRKRRVRNSPTNGSSNRNGPGGPSTLTPHPFLMNRAAMLGQGELPGVAMHPAILSPMDRAMLEFYHQPGTASMTSANGASVGRTLSDGEALPSGLSLNPNIHANLFHAHLLQNAANHGASGGAASKSGGDSAALMVTTSQDALLTPRSSLTSMVPYPSSRLLPSSSSGPTSGNGGLGIGPPGVASSSAVPAQPHTEGPYYSVGLLAGPASGSSGGVGSGSGGGGVMLGEPTPANLAMRVPSHEYFPRSPTLSSGNFFGMMPTLRPHCVLFVQLEPVELTVLDCNARFVELVGSPSSGRSVLELLAPSEGPALRRAAAEAQATRDLHTSFPLRWRLRGAASEVQTLSHIVYCRGVHDFPDFLVLLSVPVSETDLFTDDASRSNSTFALKPSSFS